MKAFRTQLSTKKILLPLIPKDPKCKGGASNSELTHPFHHDVSISANLIQIEKKYQVQQSCKINGLKDQEIDTRCMTILSLGLNFHLYRKKKQQKISLQFQVLKTEICTLKEIKGLKQEMGGQKATITCGKSNVFRSDPSERYL